MIRSFFARRSTAHIAREVDTCRASGDLSRAEGLLREALQRDPECRDLAIRLAEILEQRECFAEAEQTLRRIIALDSGEVLPWYRLGCVLQSQGRNDEAAAAFSRARECDPSHAPSANNLGCLLLARGDAAGAEHRFREALQADPALAQANHNLAKLLIQQGRNDDAEAFLESATTANPHDPVLLNLRGEVFYRLQKMPEAAAAFEAGMRADPAYALSYANLGRLLQAEGCHEQALRMFRESLDLAQDAPDVLVDLGVSLQALDRYDEALDASAAALQLAPGHALAHLNSGFTLEHLGRTEEALQHYEKAIADDPEMVDARVNRAMALLALGAYREGFAAYEFRLKKPEISNRLRSASLPRWEGGDLRGKTIVLRNEQAFGDMIQFARFVPLVAGRGARVLVDMLPELKRLYDGMDAVAGLVDLVAGGAIEADCYCPIMSLPFRLGIDLENLPARVPYFHLPADEVYRWGARLQEGQRLKVGIVWCSSPHNRIVRYKSISFETFRPLLDAAPALFVNLQKGTPLAVRDGPAVLDPEGELMDFLDTACLIANLDLVISVDTAVAHLAGALGKPVWVLLPFYADWRWLKGRADSPWYPTMRLFRQPAPGEWAPVLEQAGKALSVLAQNRALARA